jgi:dTDP-4-amino-4,6-dideoxygalactose transaminase
MDHVPAFLLEFTEAEIAAILGDAERILRSGFLSIAEYGERLEAGMARVASTAHAVCCSSGSAALEAAYKAVGVAGRRVLVPTNTNYATAAAARAAGARLTFYDNGLYPDLDDLAARLADDVAVVSVVHIGGYISPRIREIVALAGERDIPVVEDAAHAHGAKYDGTPAGGFGLLAAYSFYPSKPLTTGEGGVVATNDPRLADLVRRLRNQGESLDGLLHELPGSSWRMTEFGAAVGLVRLASLERDVRRRLAAVHAYQDLLAPVSEHITLPLADERQLPSGYKAVAVLADPSARPQLIAHLAERGVDLPKRVYDTPLHRHPIFQDVENVRDAFPEAEAFAAAHLCLPLWRAISTEQIEYVAEQVIRFFQA